jgi:hypothetical protein
MLGGFIMSIDGFYYLNVNDKLIYKRDFPGMAADIRESDLAIMLWPIDLEDRENAWQILVEALACGANLERVMELAVKWHCSDEDALIYALRVGARLFKDGDQWCATREDFVDLQESPAGFGSTALEALAGLCRSLGYKPQKMWGATFASLLR